MAGGWRLRHDLDTRWDDFVGRGSSALQRFPPIRHALLVALEDHPGYLGWTSAGVVAIHADWPMYPAEHGWRVALASLGTFPRGTVFRPLDDIDRCVLLLAEGLGRNEDPFSEENFHVALWHEDVLALASPGLVRGAVGVTERVQELNKFLDIDSRLPLTHWPDAGAPPDLIQLYARFPDGELRAINPDWEAYDDEVADWLAFPGTSRLVVTEAGWRRLDEVLSREFRPPPSLSPMLEPLLAAELYDTAVREVSVHLESEMRRSSHGSQRYGQRLVDAYIENLHTRRVLPSAQLKVLRGELRTAFRFVRNEFAHNVVSLPRSRALSLLQRMGELYEVVVDLAAERS